MDQTVEFQALALTHLDSLHSYAQVLTRNRADADDLLQETLLHAFRAFGSFKRHLSCKVWLLTIMKNAQVDRGRRLHVRPVDAEWPEESEFPSELVLEGLCCAVPPSPEETFLRGLTIEEVRGAIRRLPTSMREVVELREIEGLSYREIAEVIRTPIGTVMSRLYRGRALLRASLHDRLHERSPGTPYGV